MFRWTDAGAALTAVRGAAGYNCCVGKCRKPKVWLEAASENMLEWGDCEAGEADCTWAVLRRDGPVTGAPGAGVALQATGVWRNVLVGHHRELPQHEGSCASSKPRFGCIYSPCRLYYQSCYN